MKSKTVSMELVLCVILALLLAVGLTGISINAYWEYQQPRFHDLTMELGQPLPDVPAFLTEWADPEDAVRITPEAEIDLTSPGTQPLTFRCGNKEETVTLTIADTTAPAVVFRNIALTPGTVPQPEELVDQVSDYSAVTVRFAAEPELPDGYGETVVEVLITDACGNATSGQCSVRYVWLIGSYVLELGDTLEKEHILWSGETNLELIDQAQIDAVNDAAVGTYAVTSTNGALSCQCLVTVQDTTAPVLRVRNVLLGLGGTVTAEDFAVSAQDASGQVTLRFAQEPDLTALGFQTVTVEAVDASGNVTAAQATLEIKEDAVPPQIGGVEDMRVEIGSKPDYAAGVVAMDDRDGYVEVTIDASQEDTSKSGAYYVVYTAQDSAGNTTTIRRKVIVDHEQAEVNALVKTLADSLPDDPLEIFKWMQKKFTYYYSWGDGDPVWYGFTKWKGNCYVHAYCLQAILLEKGYDARIIWTTDKTHYWVILDIGGGVWRHLDATPGEIHSRYGLMVDWQRQSTLSGGRTWDRSQWPAAE